MGGNSTKATSGINGAGTQTQQELSIPDSAKLFFEDTKRSVSKCSNRELSLMLIKLRLVILRGMILSVCLLVVQEMQ